MKLGSEVWLVIVELLSLIAVTLIIARLAQMIVAYFACCQCP